MVLAETGKILIEVQLVKAQDPISFREEESG
jgi:hypothetical protein